MINVRTYADALSALSQFQVDLATARVNALNLDDWSDHYLASIAGAAEVAQSRIDGVDAYVKGLFATIPTTDDVMSKQWQERVKAAQDQTVSVIKDINSNVESLRFTIVDAISQGSSTAAGWAEDAAKKAINTVTSIIPWQLWVLIAFVLIVVLYLRIRK